MRVLHTAALLSPTSGILAQMDCEQEAARALGLDWHVRMYCPINTTNDTTIIHSDSAIDARKLHSSLYKLSSWIKLRRNYHRWLFEQQHHFDILLLRYYIHDPFQLSFARHAKKPIYFVNHTLEAPELASPGGPTAFLRTKLETVIGRQTIPMSAGVIGVTQEIVDYELGRADCAGKRSYVYPNGIIFHNLRLEDRRSPDIPELLFLANFAPWHGLDILLNNVAKNREQFILHLVGQIPVQLSGLTHDSRIKVHGSLDIRQIRDLSASCWIGLSSFALFRKKMKQACPLKTREYLMFGLPVYGDSPDVFPPRVPFYRVGNGTMASILGFARTTRGLKKSTVAAESKCFIDKLELLRGLHQQLLTWEPTG